MNDSTVTIVSPQHVLKQQAYILFYSKDVDIPLNGASHSGGVIGGHSQGVDEITVRPKDSKSGNHSNGSIGVGVSVGGDDLGESLTDKEKAALLALNHTHKVASSSPSSSSSQCQSQSELDSEAACGDRGDESECTSMIYVDRETRLKRKYSWAVKPFRCVTLTFQSSI